MDTPRQFTAKVIDDAIRRTIDVRLPEVARLHRQIKQLPAEEGLKVAGHDYSAALSNLSGVFVQLSYLAGFEHCTLQDRDAVELGLTNDTILGTSAQVVSTILSYARHNPKPETQLAMQILADELGIGKQYIAAAADAERKAASSSKSK